MNTTMIKKLLKMKQERVFEYIKKNVPSEYEIVADTDMYLFLVPKSNNGICLVSHIDTVRTAKMDKTIDIAQRDGIIWNQNGILGADDRAGIYGCLQLAKIKGPKPILLFTNLEEVGGIGVSTFIDDKIFDAYVDRVNLFIELDRRGINEYVSYCDIDDELKSLMALQGYEEQFGSYSDVCDLSNAYKIAHVNLGIGYFHQHTCQEFLSIPGLEFAIASCKYLMKVITKQFMIVEPTNVYPFVSHYHKKTVKSQKKANKVANTKAALSTWFTDDFEYKDTKASHDFENSFVECPNCGSRYNVSSLSDDLYECFDCGTVFDGDGEIQVEDSILATHYLK